MRKALFASVLLAMTAAQATENLPAYNVYQAPPFVVGSGGLVADVVTYFNDKLKGQYQFKLETMPRERLNQTVINNPGFKGVVLLLSPPFVGDQERKKYLWSASVLDDANAVISSPAKPIEYTGPDSLKGLSFGGVLGNRYMGLEERFGKDIQRSDVSSELANLEKVANGRIDVTLMAHSIYRYLSRQHNLTSKLHLSSKPHANFSRHIFAAKGEEKLIAVLDQVIAASKQDPAWTALLAKYNLGN
ncbi:substrate-binding periplasmic protein [Chitinimonas lacunae]|uniref:Substrate-binding periplasmic protein n=1 Tax=Chitinimonas lacunae TaxID=1963018 RepID=A0ABV8MVA4_9NEIS